MSLLEKLDVKNLFKWVGWEKILHQKYIDLALTRVALVAKRLELLDFFKQIPVITVTGTNGKGSTVAALEAIYLEAEFKVGSFSSPFLINYNEQIKILGKEIADDEIINACYKIKIACEQEDMKLTPFEITTLIALENFKRANIEVCILEVGLGGRLDAVNIVDSDVAIVTNIALDHTEILGATRELIAHEKAGIFRAGKLAICGDFNAPITLIEDAKKISAILYCQNIQFGYETDGFKWSWWSETNRLEQLPLPKLLLQNMSCVLMSVELLQKKLPVSFRIIENALTEVSLPGRIQIVGGNVQHIYDVSHNPAAVTSLVHYLNDHPISGRTNAVFSMLTDKDITGVIKLMEPVIDEWYVAPLNTERAASIDVLTQHFMHVINEDVLWFDTITHAYQVACKHSKKSDRIIVFGSFYTVAEVLSFTKQLNLCKS